MSIVGFFLISISSFIFFVNTMEASPSKKRIRMVGSTAVYPFAAGVAEQFGKLTDYKTPIVEATGTGGGFKIFCQGSTLAYPDAVVASRPIQKVERDKCAAVGVVDIIQLIMGDDGIVLAEYVGKKRLSLTLEQFFNALASHVYRDGKWIVNPFQKWSDISPEFPNISIKVLGPPPSSGTHSIIMELVIQPISRKYGVPPVNDIYIRQDGHYIEAGSNENVIARKLILDPDAFGIFSYAFLMYNKESLQAAAINGVEPTIQSISNKTYPLSRPLFIYAKKENLKKVPGLHDFLSTFFDEGISGQEGYLVRKGLVPLSQTERRQQLRILEGKK